jgi:hypothetical protein
MNPARLFVASGFAIAMAGALDPALAAWPNDPGVNVRIAPSVHDQFPSLCVEDGAGGAFFVWPEAGLGYGYDVHAQHLTAQGLVAPGWPAAGIIVCGAQDNQFPTAVVSDGAGGFIVAWDDHRIGTDPNIYAQRITGDGTAVWAVDGAPVCTEVTDQNTAQVCSDRAGGAIFVWQDFRNYGSTQTDLFAQRLSSTGAPLWTAGGVSVCSAPDLQYYASVVNDGTVGGAYFAWRDYRSGPTSDLYALRLDQYGFVRAGWGIGGSAVCTAAGDQSEPAMISDGAFGAIITWLDFRSNADVYAMRMYPSGPTAPGWTPNGVALTSDFNTRQSPALATDGAGGAIVAWTDYRLSTAPDIFARRISAGGIPAWPAGGIPLTAALDGQYFSKVVSDGAGGAIVGWLDTRADYAPMIFAQHVTSAGAIASGFAPDGNAIATAHWVQGLAACSDGSGGAIFAWQNAYSPQAGFAQRIDRWGYLGAQPTIVSVKDVPHDQGGLVKVSWNRSPLDALPDYIISSYLVYRSVPPQAALAALASGKAVIAEAREGEAGVIAQPRASSDHRRTLLTSVLAGATYYWEYLASVSAGQLPGYSYLAATGQDSVPGSNPKTLFMIRAQDYYSRFWLSDPDSGYSTDNLAPAAPVPFTGAYGSGATHLHWGANAEPDFSTYRLYRGSTSGFVPGPGNLVASQPDTGYADAGAAGSYYKLIAVDSHGNESPVSLLSPSGTVDVTTPPTAWALALAPALPNPSARVTTCRFTLPSEGRVRVTMHDAAGRLVRVLIDARMPAGEHSVRWTGEHEAGGRMPSGLYFARLAFAGRVLTTKVARVE